MTASYQVDGAASGDSGAKVEVIGTGVAEAFFARLKVNLIAALFVALPVLLYQIWMFVVPGLKATEARYVRSFVFAGTLFFLAGSAFCHQVMLPVGLPFFLAESPTSGSHRAFASGNTFRLCPR